MAKKVLIELDEEKGLEFPVNHASERVREYAIYDVKRYDRDGLGLPSVFILSESKDNKSLNIGITLDKVSDGLKNGMFIKDEDFICFHETKERGLEQVKYSKASMEMTPEHQTIINKTKVGAEAIKEELSRGLNSEFTLGEKLDLSNESMPSLDDVLHNKKKGL